MKTVPLPPALLAAGAVVLALLGIPETLEPQTLVIRAEQVMTATGEGTVGPRYLVVRDGAIASITREAPREIPAGAVRLEAAYLTPGFIDARTTLGVSGLIPADDDLDEGTGPNQAHLRAVDAFDLKDPAVIHALRSGVTVVQAGPGRANSMGGQAGIFLLHAPTTAAAVVRFPSGLVFSLTEAAKLTYGEEGRYPSTRMANVGLIRQALVDAGRYARRAAGESPPPRELRAEALARVLSGELPALVSAERVDELATALRLAEEFGLELVLVGARDAHLVVDRLAASSAPVLLGPPGDAALRPEGTDALLGVPAHLRSRTIPFALVSGDDDRALRLTLLDRAREAVRGGLSPEAALEAITLAPARILGLGERMGSLQVGKEAHLVLFDGDPLAYGTRVLAVVVRGEVAFQRQDQAGPGA